MRKPAGKRRVMADCSNDFKRFLYANYPDDYRRATAENAPDDVVTTILSRHENHYKIWRDIPDWIKSRYRDIIPTEVLNGNENVRGFVEEEEQKLNQEEKETRELMDYTVTLLALGYAAETAAITTIPGISSIASSATATTAAAATPPTAATQPEQNSIRHTAAVRKRKKLRRE